MRFGPAQLCPQEYRLVHGIATEFGQILAMGPSARDFEDRSDGGGYSQKVEKFGSTGSDDSDDTEGCCDSGDCRCASAGNPRIARNCS